MNDTVIVNAPASKSLSHRHIIAASLARGESVLGNVLESEDLERTIGIFEMLGAFFQKKEAGNFLVHGMGGMIMGSPDPRNPLSLFVGESGTTCRLITAILAAGRGMFRLHGAGRMHDRPMADLCRALEEIGIKFHFEEKDGHLPFIMEARGLRGKNGESPITVEISMDESSQYLSGLLLAAPLIPGGLKIRLTGKKAVSWPYVSLTLDVLQQYGISFKVEEKLPDGYREVSDWRKLTEVKPGFVRFVVSQGQYLPGDHIIEGDWSGASYFLAAGAIGPKAVKVTGLGKDSLQGDAAILSILESMGARIEADETGITVYPSELAGVTVSMAHCPDLAPTVAALAAHAKGVTRIIDAAHLKIKESDRLAAPAEELRKIGCAVELADDGMTITPPAGGPSLLNANETFVTHDDHRIAMSLSLLGLVGRKGGSGFKVVLDNPGCVSKSFPHFWELWAKVSA